MKTYLRDLKAFWMLDSRANPTVEVRAFVERNGNFYSGSFIVLSEASTSEFETLELRDQDSEFHITSL